MNIVFTTDQTYLHGGIERTLSTRANYLHEYFNYDVTIITTEQKTKDACYGFHDGIKQIDLEVNYIRGKSYFHPFNIRKAKNHFRRLNKYLQIIDPDVVIVVNYAFDFFFIPFLGGKFFICKEFHGSRFFYHQRRNSYNLFRNFKIRFNDFIESKYDSLIVLNEDEKQYFKSDNLIVIPNAISQFEHRSDLQNKKAIALGRMAPVKGFDTLIDCWSQVVKVHPDWVLHIYGDDYLGTEMKLKEQISRLNIKNNVFIMGTTNDTRTTMLSYSLCLMTSRTECFPMVLLEALSVGLPIVSFDCPTGPRNIIVHKESGLLIENENNQEFIKKVISLIANSPDMEELGRGAYKRSSFFYEERIMKIWDNFLKSFVND